MFLLNQGNDKDAYAYLEKAVELFEKVYDTNKKKSQMQPAYLALKYLALSLLANPKKQSLIRVTKLSQELIDSNPTPSPELKKLSCFGMLEKRQALRTGNCSLAEKILTQVAKYAEDSQLAIMAELELGILIIKLKIGRKPGSFFLKC